MHFSVLATSLSIESRRQQFQWQSHYQIFPFHSMVIPRAPPLVISLDDAFSLELENDHRFRDEVSNSDNRGPFLDFPKLRLMQSVGSRDGGNKVFTSLQSLPSTYTPAQFYGGCDSLTNAVTKPWRSR